MLTAVRTTVDALQAQSPLALEFCDAAPRVRIPAGDHRMVARSSAALSIDSVTLMRARTPSDTGSGVREPAQTSRWDSEHRAVELGARTQDTLLVIPENTNLGWTATLGGKVLASVTVDGWQQGYVVPAGAPGTVHLDFTPGPDYRNALAVGAGAVLLLILLAVLPAWPARERTRRLPRVPGSVMAVLAAFAVTVAALFGTALVGGLVGLAALAVLWVLSQVAGRWAPALLGGVAAGALLAGGAMLLVDADGTAGGRQVLAVVALSAVVAGALPDASPRRLRLRRGSPGPAPAEG
jgi:arabinofuranan 3-O-arabinosyltransferase